MRKITVEEIKQQITNIHKNIVSLKEETYVNTTTKCIFYDCDYGEFEAIPANIKQGQGHPNRGRLNTITKQTSSLDYIKKRIHDIHGNTIEIIGTYVNNNTLCLFNDIEYGQWFCRPGNILSGKKHPVRARILAAKRRQLNVDEVCERLVKVHGTIITLDKSTFVNMLTKARFIDVEYGSWYETPNNILNGRSHRKRMNEKKRLTSIRHFGTNHPSQNKEIHLKMNKTSTKRYVKKYWKTNEDFVCQGSYEAAFLDWINMFQYEIEWQIPFTMPNQRVYFVDAFIKTGPYANTWIEIKGFFRGDAKEKWDWFHSKHLNNSQLWTKKELREIGILPKK